MGEKIFTHMGVDYTAAGFYTDNRSEALKVYRTEGRREVLRRIVVDMQNTLFSSAVAEALRHFDLNFQVLQSDDPAKTAGLCRDVNANVLLMEVRTGPQTGLEERMRIRDELKKQLPACKIVLVVDENSDRMLADKIRQAKKDGLIDQFIYGSVSADYLSAMIDTL